MPLKNLYNPDLSLDELMTVWPETIPVFIRHRMLCVGCFIARFDTVADACREYELNPQTFYAELESALNRVQSLRPE